MRSLVDVSSFIGELLGHGYSEIFDSHTREADYFAKAMALDDLESSLEDVSDKMEELARGILMEITSSYLQDYYGSDSGDLDINMDSGRIYDKDMNLIEPLALVSDKQASMVRIMVRRYMATFKKGRKLAIEILSKKDERETRGKMSPKAKEAAKIVLSARDYFAAPPLERIEVEIMRLERKLPNISKAEAKKLSSLYKKSREAVHGGGFCSSGLEL